MKIIKNNIEQQIRKQIEEREITPSRDLWSEIESQSVVKSPKPLFNWFLVAACLILTFSLGALFFFSRENKQAESPGTIVQIIKPSVENPVERVAHEQHTAAAKDHQEKTMAENKESDLQKQETPAFAQQDELPAIKQRPAQIISDISPIQTGKVIAQADSSKAEVRKKRYVDPATLLFSVEHKDVIEKTKGKSNVATIDLN